MFIVIPGRTVPTSSVLILSSFVRSFSSLICCFLEQLSLSLKNFEASLLQQCSKIMTSNEELSGREYLVRQESEGLRQVCRELRVQQEQHRKECEMLRQLLDNIRVDCRATCNRGLPPCSPSGPTKPSGPQPTMLIWEDSGAERSRTKGQPVDCSTFSSTRELDDRIIDLESYSVLETNPSAPAARERKRPQSRSEPTHNSSWVIDAQRDNAQVETRLPILAPGGSSKRAGRTPATNPQRYESGSKRQRRAATAGKVEEPGQTGPSTSANTLQTRFSTTACRATNGVQADVHSDLVSGRAQNEAARETVPVEEPVLPEDREKRAPVSASKHRGNDLSKSGTLQRRNSEKAVLDHPAVFGHGYQLRIRKERPNYRCQT